jgi:hypothetical protein
MSLKRLKMTLKTNFMFTFDFPINKQEEEKKAPVQNEDRKPTQSVEKARAKEGSS